MTPALRVVKIGQGPVSSIFMNPVAAIHLWQQGLRKG